MKTTLTTIFILLTSIVSLAQDIIIMNNGRQIKCKVEQTDSINVFIKIFKDGNIFDTYIKREDVKTINYGNVLNNNETSQLGNSQQFKTDTTFRHILLGIGYDFGVIYPNEFYKFVDEYANYYKLKVGHSLDYIAVGFKGSFGYRLNNKFDINIAGAFAINQKVAYDSNNKGNVFNLTKLSAGLISNYRIPIIRKLGINILGGLMYNNIGVSAIKESGFSENSWGFRLQGGANFYATKLITLQALIGGEYASAYKNFEMDFSGALFSINIIFNK